MKNYFVPGSVIIVLHFKIIFDTLNSLIRNGYCYLSLVAQTVKNLPAVQETQLHPWVGKIPWEKGMATHSSIFDWRNSRTEEPGGLQSMGLQRVGHD